MVSGLNAAFARLLLIVFISVDINFQQGYSSPQCSPLIKDWSVGRASGSSLNHPLFFGDGEGGEDEGDEGDEGDGEDGEHLDFARCVR